VAHVHGRRFAREDEESGLEGVLGIMEVVKDAAADAQDHRPMSAHQRCEGRLIAGSDETSEQLAIGKSATRSLNVLEYPSQASRHIRALGPHQLIPQGKAARP
jgi:hypothetical protein